jgi:spore coat protein A
MDIYGRMLPTLDGKRFTDPVTETPQNNTTEVWKILNLTPDTHPIHLHLVNFQIVQRRPFNVATYLATGVVNYTGPAVAPPTNELLKDTIQMNPGEETTIIMNFNSYTGRYVWHCHILEHEEYDMMRYMNVTP